MSDLSWMEVQLDSGNEYLLTADEGDRLVRNCQSSWRSDDGIPRAGLYTTVTGSEVYIRHDTVSDAVSSTPAIRDREEDAKLPGGVLDVVREYRKRRAFLEDL